MSDMDIESLNQQYTDLLDERVGGRALSCSDEWFAPCENLVKHEEPIFREGHFVSTGQWMDGWESRRSFGRRARKLSGLDHDWCILQLGIPGTIAAIDIQTTHFKGNAPEFAAIEGSWAPDGPNEKTPWTTLLVKSATAAHSHNLFSLEQENHCTHLRLKMYPDGGVARLRAWGTALANAQQYSEENSIDLASVLVGGRGQQCSDMFYSSPSNLLMPNSGINMGDGWETKRRRDDGHDWCIIKLGLPGNICKVVLDTAHFKGNYPDHFTLEATSLAAVEGDDAIAADADWQLVLGPGELHPDQIHTYVDEILAAPNDNFTHVRLNIFPDGGISRLRVYGRPQWEIQA
ncbi:MAG: allantoicase [Halioglobus sp.]|jgi:allantoicase